MTTIDYAAAKAIWAKGANVWAAWVEDKHEIRINIGNVAFQEDLSNFDLKKCSLNFDGTIFGTAANLSGITGLMALTVSNTNFMPEFSLTEGATIHRIYLNNIKKLGDFTLNKITITNSVMLTNLEIIGSLNVQKSNLSNQGFVATPLFQFSNVKVAGDVYIGDMEFLGNFGFYDCEFSDQFACRNAKFKLPIVFERCRFASLANFSTSYFYYPPNIRGSFFHGTALWPDDREFGVNKRSPESRTIENVEACGYLKREAASKGHLRQKKSFSILEQKYRILAGQVPLLDRISFKLYGLMSDYGRSVLRTFVSLILTIVLFAILDALVKSPTVTPDLPVDWELIGNGFRESMINTLIPAKAAFADITSLKEACVKVFHVIISGVILAQMFMSVRWALNAT